MNKILNRFTSNKALKNFIIYGFGQAINLASPLLITPYIIYICGLEKLGIIAIGQSLAYILNVIIDYSSNIFGVKEISINRENNTKLQFIFSSVYFSRLFLLAIVIAIVIIMALAIPYFNRNALMIFFSISIIIGQAINPTWFLQGVENFKWITIINILSKIIYIVAVFLFLKEESDYIYANLWLGLGTILANALAFIMIIKKCNFRFKIDSIRAAKEILKRDFLFCVSQLFFAVRNYSSVLIVGFFAGDLVAGQFKVVEQIINLFRTYVQMFFKFSYSYICFEIDRSISKGIALWKKYNSFNVLILITGLVSVYFFSSQVLAFFRVDEHLFDQLEKYLHIGLFIPLLICGTSSLEQLLFSLNKNYIYIRLTMASTIFNILGLSFAMYFYGLEGVFYMLIITEISLVMIYYAILRKYFNGSKETLNRVE
ncbi:MULTISPECIES: oligosaccharide flippase family protein [Flavobacterium]|uniref:lipopolysaccharide biosynthesis protein n=1 Tax=Flavobacterium TaxID=237 RepID=UPI002808AF46|nr:oligosaccharide flippase family protein [Flavobacterium lindanitolerans]MDQ7959311.1 oligosaccharide flippase family protein [Flavobacterium lindanitolerans]